MQHYVLSWESRQVLCPSRPLQGALHSLQIYFLLFSFFSHLYWGDHGGNTSCWTSLFHKKEFPAFSDKGKMAHLYNNYQHKSDALGVSVPLKVLWQPCLFCPGDPHRFDHLLFSPCIFQNSSNNQYLLLQPQKPLCQLRLLKHSLGPGKMSLKRNHSFIHWYVSRQDIMFFEFFMQMINDGPNCAKTIALVKQQVWVTKVDVSLNFGKSVSCENFTNVGMENPFALINDKISFSSWSGQ